MRLMDKKVKVSIGKLLSQKINLTYLQIQKLHIYLSIYKYVGMCSALPRGKSFAAEATRVRHNIIWASDL